jgi:polyisoprenoid-binding protein YceI
MAKWTIDPDHTVAAFSVGHMMVARVRGQFNKVSGTISFDPPDMATLSVEVSIDAEGIWTGIQKRDMHLRSADFFDVQKFPAITFRSTGVVVTSLQGCRISGDLSMHGITLPVVLDAEYLGPVKSPFGETSIGISASARVNREDFGIAWNEPIENGGFMVGKEIRIELHVEADLAEQAAR